MSNISKIDAISTDIYEMLNKLGLQRVNPIFASVPSLEADIGHLLIRFPEDLDDFRDFDAPGEYRQHDIWFIFGGVIFRQEMPKDIDSPAKIELLTRKDCPIYIDCIIEGVRKHSRKSLILVQDDLPKLLFIDIETSFELDSEREIVLHRLASGVFNDFINEKNSRDTKQKIQKIIDNKDISFKQAAHEILSIRGLSVHSNLSYCLACGDGIDKLNARGEPNLFCRKIRPTRKDGTKPNPDNCRNVFRKRQELRLGLSSEKERSKHASLLYKELQQLVQLKTLIAYEELKKNHPDLYIDGRKRRSKKHS